MLADPFGKQAGTARNDLQIGCDSIGRGDGTYAFFRLGNDAVKACIEVGYLINQYF